MTEPPAKPVLFSDLRNAFDFVSMTTEIGGRAYISLDTGKVYSISDNDDEDDTDDVPPDLEESDRYVAVPDKRQLDLGRELALAFAREALPEDYGRVADYFRGRGAYRRFRDLLELRDVLAKWYEYEDRETNRALRDWCTENDIPLTDG